MALLSAAALTATARHALAPTSSSRTLLPSSQAFVHLKTCRQCLDSRRGLADSFGPRFTSTSSRRSGSNAKPPTPPSSASPSRPVDPANLVPKRYRAKVEVLPFRVGTEEARQFLHAFTAGGVLQHHRSWYEHLKLHYALTIGGETAQEVRERVVTFEKISALYLPIWMVNASVELRCRGENGRAEVTLLTTKSRFPGNSWGPMTTMPMYPDYPSDAPVSPDQPQQTLDPAQRNYQLMMDYELYDPEKHLHPKGVEIEGGIPPPLPFNISPLHLPELLRKDLAPEDRTIEGEIPREDLEEELGRTGRAWSNYKTGNPKLSPVHFEPETLKTHMLAAYPLLIPIHLAECSFIDKEGERQRVTHALGAWDKQMHTFASLFHKDGVWRRTGSDRHPFSIQTTDLFPRLPIRNPFQQHFSKERAAAEDERRKKRIEYKEKLTAKMGEMKKQFGLGKMNRAEIDELWEEADSLHIKELKDSIKSQEAEHLAVELPVAWAITLKVDELLEKANWTPLERDEREAYQARTSRVDPSKPVRSKKDKQRLPSTTQMRYSGTPPTEPRPYQWLSDKQEREAEQQHPDRKAGLGDFIHWTSPHVQRLTLNVAANKRYLEEGVPRELKSRRSLVNATAAGADIDNLLVINQSDGSTVKGSDAVKTLRASDLDCRQYSERLKPRWLKELEKNGPPAPRY
ncbi:uncharacterized protein PFL1_01636 [Pseudozyma flocculosa PF-1]|uniref:Uncharacterized protein n=1 Tax=Pseudozyma flocculosa TaxID=84751 RepID=A0A5C3EZS2_9BASI|nr:uncharacterized protein PFL1_01636 [Pseudozyma flocculosa PF-1]EPQ30735.1 hypothetical protein PFL1_01636 [Pseudozyma flocculosa PF-1]SPO36917.1 uncharacterized protein PSFLO_02388 [Pseudozyma flocculosa]